MKLKNKPGFVTSPMERAAYCLFFLGQNILWGFAGYVETFLTDIGFAAATAAAILLVPKIWDAVNDVLFGYIVDRHVFKNGQKFMPWVRIGTAAVGITTVAMFAIPQSMGDTTKVIWFLLAYILFDVAYTVLDAPAFAVTTVMTADIPERTSIIAGGKLWSMVDDIAKMDVRFKRSYSYLNPLEDPRMRLFDSIDEAWVENPGWSFEEARDSVLSRLDEIFRASEAYKEEAKRNGTSGYFRQVERNEYDS